MIVLHNLRKTYSGKLVLKGINHTFKKNKIYGIVGPNGAGKTTLMKCMLGLLVYDGMIVFEDKEMSYSYMPETINVYGYLKGVELIELFAKVQGLNWAFLLNNFEILSIKLNYHDREKLVSQHSKGNLRKLMLIYALSTKKSVAFLDEPFSGLDPISVELLKRILPEYKKGSTIILNTHFFDTAKEICDEIVFLNNGEVINVTDREHINAIDLIQLYGKQ